MRIYLLGGGVVLMLAVVAGLSFAFWSNWEMRVGAESVNNTIGISTEDAYETLRGRQAIRRLAATTAKRAFDSRTALFVDARSAFEFKVGHIPGALCLTALSSGSKLRLAMAGYRADTRIIAYCAGTGCRSSHVLARRLVQELGYENVEVLDGGWPAWQKAGFPIAIGDDTGY